MRELVAAGTTVLLTTQYLDEADQLADSICLIDAGRAVTTGTPDALKAALGGDRVDVVLRRPDDLTRAASLLTALGDVHVDPELRRVSTAVRDRVAALAETLRILGDAELEAEDINLRRPTLDEVFLEVLK